MRLFAWGLLLTGSVAHADCFTPEAAARISQPVVTCALNEVDRLEASREPAETIATAVISACDRSIGLYRDIILACSDTELADAATANIKRRLREFVIEKIVKTRAERAS